MGKLKKDLYDNSNPSIQAIVDRFRYFVGFLPRVGKIQGQKRVLFPKPFRTALIISADFELAWGWNREKNSNTNALALAKAQQARENIPKLIELFDRFEIPITWATVGHLFLESCNREDGKSHPNLSRIPYFINEFWQYTNGDWFDDDPCCSAVDAPAWYAPDIIESILKSQVDHEIACHTFSHIDCSDKYCPPEVLENELIACRKAASKFGIDLKSFVFPGNISGNFETLKHNQFTSYRWHNGYELDLPKIDQYGLWQIPGGIQWEKPEKWPDNSWIKAINRFITKALETETICHLWFHPSCSPINVTKIFQETLHFIDSRRSGLWITTMRKLSDWLDSYKS